MPRSNRRQRRDRRPDYQRHRPQRQDDRATENHQDNVHVLNEPLPLSSECELREYTTEQGPILELRDMNPTPIATQSRFFAARPKGGFWGVTDDERDVLDRFRAMKMLGQGKEIIYQFSYKDDEAVTKAKKDGCPVRITSNLGYRPRDDVDRGLTQDMVEPNVSPPEEHVIRMVRASRPVIERPASRPSQAGGVSRQDPLPPQTPLRQVKKEEPE
ncbi:hypothetical protein FMEXI_13793 [Fusarium mexicanum]|uniref:Uncharacterized protein n=1 Tax=Fusarium mexicanum TaxID=751941 RepID=A0A8H5I5W1_9HYPO|nr:hypothetical protein FMEXI_13793 [Fusarium mexicanum]